MLITPRAAATASIGLTGLKPYRIGPDGASREAGRAIIVLIQRFVISARYEFHWETRRDDRPARGSSHPIAFCFHKPLAAAKGGR
jgi:hypothetical protein